MLPFLEPKKTVTVIRAAKGKADLPVKSEMQVPGMDEGLKEAMADFLRASEAKSLEGMASAIKSAFMICDSMPHEEGPHIDEDME